MKRKSPLVCRSRYRDEWNDNPRVTMDIVPGLGEDDFDRLPKREGLGKHVCEYPYATNVLDKWFRSHLGKPWSKVQKLLKEKLPDFHEYTIAMGQVSNAVEKDGVLCLNNCKPWGHKMQPIDTVSSYHTSIFYSDLKGILREIPKTKYRPQPPTVQYVIDGELIYFKRNGIVYQAEVEQSQYCVYATSRATMRRRARAFYSCGMLYYNLKGTWMKIGAPRIKQVNKKDLERHKGVIILLTDDVTNGEPEHLRRVPTIICHTIR